MITAIAGAGCIALTIALTVDGQMVMKWRMNLILLFGESLTFGKVAGTLLVVAGLILCTR